MPALAIEPVLCLLAVATNPWHGQFFMGAEPTGFDGAYVPEFGPLLWLHCAYSYTVLGVALARVIRGWVRATTSWYRGYLYALLLSIPAIAFNVIGLVLHGRVIDMTGVGFAITAPMIYVLMIRLAMPALPPVAHQRVFHKISDAVAVVDRDGVLLDVNPAAVRLLRDLSPQTPSRFLGATAAGRAGTESAAGSAAQSHRGR